MPNLTDKQWRAQDDARILADAELIKADRTRLAPAKVQAKKMAVEKKKEAAKLIKIGNTKVTPKKSIRKKPVKKRAVKKGK